MDLPERMIHQSTRYVLGRKTYAVGEHCKWLIDNWELIPPGEREVIQRDVERNCERHERNPIAGWLGHNQDVEQWDRVRALWKRD